MWPNLGVRFSLQIKESRGWREIDLMVNLEPALADCYRRGGGEGIYYDLPKLNPFGDSAYPVFVLML